ncbi:DNA cytosine methyltransferase [Iningainema tapete]|uniref:Cytosine-specific methyltransferase n=1 Tax=Iningainema tapete BLCC-T55 TaxID=2748662 RepID=A0A8J7CBV3_9CYAN|nr:DNA cytosine methyltransferase [Iningainema tapete]MBD2778771.1 DNA cytosine methyltransferase [Iningainema tapete BLCC-T55]
MYQPTILSLFSGAGGLDIGFHKAGFQIAACVEKEEICCKTLEMNLGRYSQGNCQVLHRDIREFEPKEISVSQVDFIIGGPPCQSFSAIGRRAGGIDGIQDERGSLFEHYCRLLNYYKSKGFLFENVRGILGANKGKDWQIITNAFESIGYKLYYRVLDCADYGVPQHRERLIMVGLRDGNFKFPRPTHGSDSTNHHPHITALQAIADLQDPLEPEHKYPGKYGHLLSEVPPGMNYHYFTKEMGYPNPIFAWRSRFSDFLYKAEPNKPVRTIVAQLGAYSGPFHWKNRKFTLQEFKRLQSFPDDYEFAGSCNSVLKQIGNSVPPIFAEKLAMAVLQQVFAINLGVNLLDEKEQLSFDSKKSQRAKSTRVKRLSNTECIQLNLLESVPERIGTSKIPTLSNSVKYDETIYFHYLSPKLRTRLTQLTSSHTGSIYKLHFQRVEEICSIYVSREHNGSFINTPLLQYQVKFHHPIGDGLRKIICTLLSDTAQDIPIAWDAIEDCLSRSSGYQTMMDVYGHFTEPHPIFSLSLDVLSKEYSFLLRFAREFSRFESTKKILPEEFLKSMYGSDKNFELPKVVSELRELRFDVRVHETNRTIPPGYFRCCYPFTLNINKQVSVKWKS